MAEIEPFGVFVRRAPKEREVVGHFGKYQRGYVKIQRTLQELLALDENERDREMAFAQRIMEKHEK